MKFDLKRTLAGQCRRPHGLLAPLVALTMNRANRDMISWTVSLLDIRPTDHVLEIGFGPGIGIRLMSELATEGEVTGVDFSEKMLRAATRRNAASIAQRRVRLDLADATNLPYPDSSFDKVVGINVIYFFPEPIRLLRELRRVLQPGGTVAICVTDKEDMKKVPCTQTDVFRTYSSEELVGLLEQAGLHHVHSVVKEGAFTNVCALATKA